MDFSSLSWDPSRRPRHRTRSHPQTVLRYKMATCDHVSNQDLHFRLDAALSPCLQPRVEEEATKKKKKEKPKFWLSTELHRTICSLGLSICPCLPAVTAMPPHQPEGKSKAEQHYGKQNNPERNRQLNVDERKSTIDYRRHATSVREARTGKKTDRSTSKGQGKCRHSTSDTTSSSATLRLQNTPATCE